MANGNINDAVSGNYILDIGAVFSEAWQKIKGFKRKALGAFILLYFIVFLAAVGTNFILAMLGIDITSEQVPVMAFVIQFVMQLALALIVYPLSAGVMMMGIHQAAGKPVSIRLIFSYFDQTLRLFGLYILMMLLGTIGFLLLILPGIYLAVAYTMAMPLLIEKKMGIWEALETSRKAVSKRWFTVFAIFILLAVLFILAAIPLGIGLIWMLPLGIVTMGVVYKTIFGVNP